MPPGEDGTESEDTGSLELGLTQEPSFKGNSVKFIAKRDKDADSKYPCKSYVDVCFNFDEEGKLVHKDGYTPAKIDELCPSTNIPESDWKFDFYIYSDKDCYGDVLNAPYNEHNFVCYDVKNLATQSYPNSSVDKLKPGKNRNEVICITENASKSWDFDVCVDKSTEEDRYYSKLVLDCGCKVDEYYQCGCEQDIAYLPKGCTMKVEDACKVVCKADEAG